MLMVAWPSHAAQTILVFGDSLSAAYGLEKKQGWVDLLAQRMQKQGYAYQVVNASISGETTAGGLSRIQAVLKQHQPDIVIVELGANDGLRGLPVAALKDNLNQMIQAAKLQSAQVVLVGIQIPPNYGLKYAQAFSGAFAQLAKELNTSYVPFLLDKVAGNRQLNQQDGIHPTAAAQPILLDNVWPHLKPLLKKSS
ncbi:MAG TPA: arylesterase [Methylophilus sp.]